MNGEKIGDFSRWYQYTRPALLAYVRRIGAHEAAEDIVQDTFLQAYLKRDDLLTHPNPEGWLYRAARYLYWNERRKKRGESLLFTEFDGLSCQESGFLYSLAEWKHLLSQQLSGCDYELARLVILEGCPLKEAALHLNISPQNAKTRLYRLRRKLKESCNG